LDEPRGVCARKTNFAVKRFCQIGPCQRARSRHRGASPKILIYMEAASRLSAPGKREHYANGIIIAFLCSKSESDDRSAPGEAPAHRFQHDQVALLDSAILDCGVERERHRCRGGV